MTTEAEVDEIAKRLPQHADDWLVQLAYVHSDEGRKNGARAYRMSYNYEVCDGVIEWAEHSGGYLLSTDLLKALFEAELADVKWPCDEPGYVPESAFLDDDDDDYFECNTYCGHCEPDVVITPLGRLVARRLEERK